MILIYTTHITRRITYISKFLFTSILGVPVNLTSNRDEFGQYEGPKINYSEENFDTITIQPHTLLFENDIRMFTPVVAWFKEVPVLFPSAGSSAMPFDPFAAAFFMVTRYEEYWPQPTDRHGRVLTEKSVAFQHGFLEIPVVDHWALAFQQLIEKHYPAYLFPKREYNFTPTIDIDIAYAYLYRSIWRIAGATAKSIVKGNMTDIDHRIQVLLRHKTDPYDTFPLLFALHRQYDLDPIFFFQVGKYGRYDKNISPSHPAMQKLIRQIQAEHKIGIHPSYQSNSNTDQLRDEITTLENIIAKPVSRSRQHFLILQFPSTYQNLISCGITEDYTMGYSSHTGFRAGTCTPFYFYDLSTEKETALVVYPFQVMDGTLNQYLKLSPLEAIERINRLNTEVRKVNGTFISLWHNESLSEMREWSGWREVYSALNSIASK